MTGATGFLCWGNCNWETHIKYWHLGKAEVTDGSEGWEVWRVGTLLCE